MISPRVERYGGDRMAKKEKKKNLLLSYQFRAFPPLLASHYETFVSRRVELGK